ncbi:MAG TPA: RNA polymerase subunit sigma [Betaproteobacteria bacterium]|nr:RNA polymerase subunit sigma [Betaproteobacteria bacterium]
MTDDAPPTDAAVAAVHPEQWLERHGDVLYRYALAHLRDAHHAEEAVQETLLAALESRHRYTGKSTERTWLIGILKHKLIDHGRRQWRETPLDEENYSPDDPADGAANNPRLFDESGHWTLALRQWGNPAHALAQRQFWQALDKCLAAMPPKLARIFMLREVSGVESEKICQELGVTATNLWTMLYRSRMSLRHCLERTWLA